MKNLLLIATLIVSNFTFAADLKVTCFLRNEAGIVNDDNSQAVCFKFSKTEQYKSYKMNFVLNSMAHVMTAEAQGEQLLSLQIQPMDLPAPNKSIFLGTLGEGTPKHAEATYGAFSGEYAVACLLDSGKKSFEKCSTK